MELVFLEEPEGVLMRAPKGEELQPAFFVFEDFLLELRHMFLPPVVGNLGEAELPDHLGAFRRAAFHRIERHDAPGDEVLALEQRRGFGRSELGKWRREQNDRQEAEMNEGVFFHVGIFSKKIGRVYFSLGNANATHASPVGPPSLPPPAAAITTNWRPSTS